MFKKVSLILFLITVFYSCTPHLLPPANAGLVTDLNKLTDDIQSLYDNPDRSYSDAKYQEIDAEIAAIVATEQSRPHAKLNLTAAVNIQSVFSTFEAGHKATGTITANVAKAHKDDMFGTIKPLLIAELSIK